MLRPAFAVAAIVGAASVLLVTADDEDFGPRPIAETEWHEEGGSLVGVGNSSSGNNTNGSTTTTTTTTLPEMPHVHLSYFVSRLNQTDAEGNNPHLENLQCGLARVGQGAYFLNLEHTESVCTKMPAVAGVDGDWFYSLKMHPAPPYGEVNEIISFLAFCPDSTCSNTTCKISRAAIPDSTITPLKYDRCFPTNAKEKFSYFVRQGHGANMVHDICLLKNMPAESAKGVTELRYPSKTMCDDHEPGAVVATSLRSISNDDCDFNHFDNTYYKLRLQSNKIDGFVGCTDPGCELTSCSRYDGFWGECSGHGEESTKLSHFKFFETRANGMTMASTASIPPNRGIPKCSGMEPTPTPRVPSTTTVPSAAHTKHPYKMPAVIMSALIGAFIVAYLIFWVLRRRKLRRMSAYAALQDDPTF